MDVYSEMFKLPIKDDQPSELSFNTPEGFEYDPSTGVFTIEENVLDGKYQITETGTGSIINIHYHPGVLSSDNGSMLYVTDNEFSAMMDAVGDYRPSFSYLSNIVTHVYFDGGDSCTITVEKDNQYNSIFAAQLDSNGNIAYPDIEETESGYSVSSVSAGTFYIMMYSVDEAHKYEASVDGTEYTTIQEAIYRASSSDTVHVLKDISKRVTLIIDKNLVIDLGGHTINIANSTADSTGLMISGSTVSIEDGTIVNTHSQSSGSAESTLLIDDGAIVTASNLRIEIYRGYEVNSAVVVKGGSSFTLGEYSYVVGSNTYSMEGTLTGIEVVGSDKGSTRIIIDDGNILGEFGNNLDYGIHASEGNADIEILDGYVSADYGIYMCSDGTIDMVDGYVSGNVTGIELGRGELRISGGIVYSVYDDFSVTDDGPHIKGAAVAVAPIDKGVLSAVIISGDLEGPVAFVQADPGNTGSDYSFIISGGTFTSSGESPIITDEVHGFVTGGTFSGPVSDYVQEGVETTVDDFNKTVVLSPVRFVSDQTDLYSDSMIIQSIVPDGATDVRYTVSEGASIEDNKIKISEGATGFTVTLYASYNGIQYIDAMYVVCHGSTIKSVGGSVEIGATYDNTLREELDNRGDEISGVPDSSMLTVLDIYRTDGSKEPTSFRIGDLLKEVHNQNFNFGTEPGEWAVYVVHLGDSVDYPVVEYTDDNDVIIHPSGFSTFAFFVYQVEEPEPEPEPSVIWDDDDDYVPLPPVIVEEGEDNSVEVVACAAVAVVAALMAAFLIIDRRKG